MSSIRSRLLATVVLAGLCSASPLTAGDKADSRTPAAKGAPAAKPDAAGKPAPAAKPETTAKPDTEDEKPAPSAGSFTVHNPPGPGVPVALIGTRPITLAELDAAASDALLKVRQQEYEARLKALEDLIAQHLLDREAASRGVSRADLLKAEVLDKLSEPTQAQIDELYESNKDRIGDTPRSEVDPRIKAFLREQQLEEGKAALLMGLHGKYGVKVLLEPPRLAVSSDTDAAKGPADAPITIVEFSDYECGFCSRAEAVVNELMKKYEGKIRLVYRDFPLEFHPNAHLASQAAECAGEQGKFWEMHGALFADQSKLAKDDLIATASKIKGVNKKKFKACLDDGRFKAEVDKDLEDGGRYGVTGTPTFFVNGIVLEGAQPLEAFSEVIDQELQRRR